VGQVADERGAWRTYGEKTIYDNRWVRLGLVDVEAPNGERWDYHVVHFGRIAIAMIVNEDDDTVLMLWRYRFRHGHGGARGGGGVGLGACRRSREADQPCVVDENACRVSGLLVWRTAAVEYSGELGVDARDERDDGLVEQLFFALDVVVDDASGEAVGFLEPGDSPVRPKRRRHW